MEIYVLHRLKDDDGTIKSQTIKAFTNKELALDGLEKEVKRIEKSFNDKEEEYEKNDFPNGYELWNDSVDMFIVIDKIELEGSIKDLSI